MDTYTAIRKVMKEQKAWSLHNFGPTTPENQSDPLIGVIEELGELAHAVLKKKQGIRGTPEEHNAAMFDAVGDMQIFLLDAMNRFGIPFSPQFADRLPGCAEDSRNKQKSFLWHAANITTCCFPAGYEESSEESREAAVRQILCNIWALAGSLGVDPLAALVQTWENTVSKRDWVRYPGGLPDLVDNSAELIQAHDARVIRLSGEHISQLAAIAGGTICGDEAKFICREITQAHYAQLLEGGLV
jgi:hypothetical protein